jgi:putative phosphoesterase
MSDSHGRVGLIQDITENEKFDKAIFLGDGIKDFEYINDERITKLAGNCDLFSTEQKEVYLHLENVKIFATHGHIYKVKLGLFGLLKEAKTKQMDLVLYGHTHTQKEEEIDNICFVNPGSVANGKYAIIDIKKNDIKIKLKSI